MPETTFLHIQTRGRAATRVVELPGASVRVGRGAQCEVRLGEPALAEVECLLRRSGESWHVQPLSPSGRVAIDGRPVDHLRTLSPGVALQVGEHWLTLRPARAKTEGLGSFDTPIPVDPPSSFLPRGASADPERLDDRRDEESARPVPPNVTPLGGADKTERLGASVGDGWEKARRDEKVWEARWRAAGAAMKAREPSRKVADRRPSYPKPAEPPRPGLVPVDPPSAWVRPVAPTEIVPPRDPSERLKIVRPDDEEPAEADEFPGDEAAEAAPSDPRAVSLADAPAEPLAPALDEVADQGKAETPVEPPIAEAVAVAFPAPLPEPPIEPTAPATPSESIETASTEPPAAESAPTAALGLLSAAPPPPRKPRGGRRPSPGPRPSPSLPPLPQPDELEWPSARVILAAHAMRAEPSAAAKPRPRREVRPEPTEAVAPGQWSLPLWLAWLPLSFVTLALAGAGTFLAWTWGRDAQDAGAVADRLLRPGRPADEPPSADSGAPRTWWRTTAPHLSLRAASLSASPGDPTREEDARQLLDAARSASPLEPLVPPGAGSPRESGPRPLGGRGVARAVSRRALQDLDGPPARPGRQDRPGVAGLSLGPGAGRRRRPVAIGRGAISPR